MIGVLLVDDHDLMRTGLRKVLEDTDGIEIVGEAGSGEEAIEKVRTTRPDVVLMDVNMPGMGGLEATRQIARLDPRIGIVALSMHTEGLFPRRLLASGARGYLTKGSHKDELVQAIRMVVHGRRYVCREVAETLALDSINGTGHSFDGLSTRELQVVRMISQGYTNQSISDTLHLSPKTVSTYRTRVYKKLGIHSDVELTHLAIRHGVIDPGFSDTAT